MKTPIFVILATLFAVSAHAGFHHNFQKDAFPCAKEIKKCLDETRLTKPELAGCLGTAYGLYFAGENGISACKDGKFNSSCLVMDQAKVIAYCHNLGTFPESCSVSVMVCALDYSN
jgi:hypothetical protein